MNLGFLLVLLEKGEETYSVVPKVGRESSPIGRFC